MSYLRPRVPTGYIVGATILALVALVVVLSSCSPPRNASIDPLEATVTDIPDGLAGGDPDRYVGTACEGMSYDACRGLGIDTLHEMSTTFVAMPDSDVDDLATTSCDLMDMQGVDEAVAGLLGGEAAYEGMFEDMGYLVMYAGTVECPRHYDAVVAWSEDPYNF